MYTGAIVNLMPTAMLAISRGDSVWRVSNQRTTAVANSAVANSSGEAIFPAHQDSGMDTSTRMTRTAAAPDRAARTRLTPNHASDARATMRIMIMGATMTGDAFSHSMTLAIPGSTASTAAATGSAKTPDMACQASVTQVYSDHQRPP